MNKKIKILHITSSFHRGGVEGYLLNFLERADFAGFEHHIFVGRDEGPLQERYHRLPVRIVKVKCTPRRFLHSLPRGWSYCKKNGIDIIHGHNYWFYRYAYFLSLLTGLPLFTSNYGLGLWKKKRQLDLERRIFRRARMNTVISRAILEKGKSLLPEGSEREDKFKLIYPIIDDKPMQKLASYDKKKLLEKFKLDNGKPVFTIVGRIDRLKGHRVAIDALDRINRDGLRANLLMIGELEDRSILTDDDLAKDYLTYLNYYEEIEEIWKVTDYFLIPSLSEGTPLVLVEYFAVGRPVIASDISGNRELIRDKENGYLFKTGEVEDLVRKIEAILSGDQNEEVVSRAREFYQSELSPEKFVRTIEGYYRRALAPEGL
ncbi:MAG: glycosyltransferase family 4 protein [Candidatus Krumholzibacteriota bacterium]|nr:glycosyltransferase family 4 protein [Candidatus Krumholzibacteriota bacterium]